MVPAVFLFSLIKSSTPLILLIVDSLYLIQGSIHVIVHPLPDKKLSIKVLKPKLFALASKKANQSFDDTLKSIARTYGEVTNNNKK